MKKMNLLSRDYKKFIKKLGKNFRNGEDVILSGSKTVDNIEMGICFNILKAEAFNIHRDGNTVTQIKLQYPFTDEFHGYMEQMKIKI